MCRESGCGCRIDEDSEMKTHSTQIEDREVGGRKDVSGAQEEAEGTKEGKGAR